MAFQNITFKHTNSDTNSSIREFTSQKLATLDKYIGDETDVRCEVEFEKVTSQKTGPICRTEVNIWLRGTLFRSEVTQETFEAAVNLVRDELDYEMKKAHKKHHSLIRKGGRKIKEMMLFGQKK
jgi:ribosomal subunit interface protein